MVNMLHVCRPDESVFFTGRFSVAADGTATCGLDMTLILPTLTDVILAPMRAGLPTAGPVQNGRVAEWSIAAVLKTALFSSRAY